MSDGGVDSRGALEAVERVLNRGGDSRDVLRSVLEVLHARGVESGRVRYLKDGGLTGGISIGGGPSRIVTPIVFRDVEVGVLELAVDDLAFGERVATLISAHVSAASPTPARNGPADLPP